MFATASVQSMDSLPQTSFWLPVPDLIEWAGWNDKAKEGLQSLGREFFILPFVERYFQKIENFYLWLWDNQTQWYKEEIEATNKLRELARAMDASN